MSIKTSGSLVIANVSSVGMLPPTDSNGPKLDDIVSLATGLPVQVEPLSVFPHVTAEEEDADKKQQVHIWRG